MNTFSDKEDRRVKKTPRFFARESLYQKIFTSSPNLRPKTMVNQTESNGDYVQNIQLLK